jgi:hypothetical protein
MTGAVLDRPCAEPADHRPVTLDELLNSTLEAARTRGSAECPVCHAPMTYTRAGAVCGGCGSRLT